MNIKLIIFDFDGTIMDTKNTIIAAKQETLRQMGVDVAMRRLSSSLCSTEKLPPYLR